MTAKPSSDPDVPEYGNDDPTWGEPHVMAFSVNGGELLCRDCAEDAIQGGMRLKQARVIKGRICGFCGAEIGTESEGKGSHD